MPLGANTKDIARRRQLKVFQWWVIAKYLAFIKQHNIRYDPNEITQDSTLPFHLIRVLYPTHMRSKLWSGKPNAFKLLMVMFGHSLPEWQGTDVKSLDALFNEDNSDERSVTIKTAYDTLLSEIAAEAGKLFFTKNLIINIGSDSQPCFHVGPVITLSSVLPDRQLGDVYIQTYNLLVLLEGLAVPDTNPIADFYAKGDYKKSAYKYFNPALLTKFIKQKRRATIDAHTKFKKNLNAQNVTESDDDEDDDYEASITAPLLGAIGDRELGELSADLSPTRRFLRPHCINKWRAIGCTLFATGAVAIAAGASEDFRQFLQELDLQAFFVWLSTQNDQPSKQAQMIEGTIAPIVLFAIVLTIFWLLACCFCRRPVKIQPVTFDGIEDLTIGHPPVGIDANAATTVVKLCNMLIGELHDKGMRSDRALEILDNYNLQSAEHTLLETTATANLIYDGLELFELVYYDANNTYQTQLMTFPALVAMTYQLICEPQTVDHDIEAYKAAVMRFLKHVFHTGDNPAALAELKTVENCYFEIARTPGKDLQVISIQIYFLNSTDLAFEHCDAISLLQKARISFLRQEISPLSDTRTFATSNDDDDDDDTVAEDHTAPAADDEANLPPQKTVTTTFSTTVSADYAAQFEAVYAASSSIPSFASSDDSDDGKYLTATSSYGSMRSTR